MSDFQIPFLSSLVGLLAEVMRLPGILLQNDRRPGISELWDRHHRPDRHYQDAAAPARPETDPVHEGHAGHSAGNAEDSEEIQE